ncbi:MAG: glycosyltransferase [Cryomorphaceae bacterium]|nr:glycosyltransferase [Cryomorphaceae bacterium]
MPVYNGEKFLNEAIISILGQSFEEFEFLIINDGSTDSTEKIILSYTDNRIRYVKNETNLKLIETLNKGIVLSQGKYIVRMDADDISAIDRIEKQVAFMEKNKKVGLCGTWITSFGEVTETICKYKEAHDEIVLKMLYQCHFCHPSLIIRKEVFEQGKVLFDSEFLHAEDYELYLRLSTKWKFHNLQESLIKYRIHSLSVSRQNEKIQLENSQQIRKMFFSLLGIDCSQEELKAFEALNHEDYKAISITSENIQILLESMLKGNHQKKVFDISFLEKEVKALWLNYCYNRESLKTYRNSQLLFDEKLVQKVNKPKWLLKSILN